MAEYSQSTIFDNKNLIGSNMITLMFKMIYKWSIQIIDDKKLKYLNILLKQQIKKKILIEDII